MLTRPQSVTSAVKLIWLTIVIDVAMMVAGYDGTTANAQSLTFNGVMLMFYALVTIKISGGVNWARHCYALLVVMELALVAAWGLSDASELEEWVTYLTLPLELWIVFKMFGSDGDAWFRAMRARRTK